MPNREITANTLRMALDSFVEEPSRPTAAELGSFLAFVTDVVEDWKNQLKHQTEMAQRPCCQFFKVNNVTYKGVYLPSPDEFEAHGYNRELYDKFMVGWKESIDRYGKV